MLPAAAECRLNLVVEGVAVTKRKRKEKESQIGIFLVADAEGREEK